MPRSFISVGSPMQEGKEVGGADDAAVEESSQDQAPHGAELHLCLFASGLERHREAHEAHEQLLERPFVGEEVVGGEAHELMELLEALAVEHDVGRPISGVRDDAGGAADGEGGEHG